MRYHDLSAVRPNASGNFRRGIGMYLRLSSYETSTFKKMILCPFMMRTSGSNFVCTRRFSRNMRSEALAMATIPLGHGPY